MNKEYVFDIPGGHVEIYTGRDSARTFRDSFFKRLAEALLNLAWLLRAKQPVSDAEMDAFLAIPEVLAATTTIPPHVIHARDALMASQSGGPPNSCLKLAAGLALLARAAFGRYTKAWLPRSGPRQLRPKRPAAA